MAKCSLSSYNRESWLSPSSRCCLPTEIAMRREIQICHYYCSLTETKWKVQPMAHRSIGLQPRRRETVTRSAQRLPPPKIIPFSQSQESALRWIPAEFALLTFSEFLAMSRWPECIRAERNNLETKIDD